MQMNSRCGALLMHFTRFHSLTRCSVSPPLDLENTKYM